MRPTFDYVRAFCGFQSFGEWAMDTIQKEPELEQIVAENKEVITAFIRGLIDDAQKAFIADRRRELRHPLSVPVTVTPVGDANRRLTGAFVAVTRDISTTGISFLHTNLVNDHYLNLRFTESRPDAPTIVIEVLRRRKIGPLWEIAGKFLPAIQ
jgi:hypothetical protein